MSRFIWLIWLIKQLLPLTYRSHYYENGIKMFAVWRMWLGRMFDVERFIDDFDNGGY